jgi:hypothetical protein
MTPFNIQIQNGLNEVGERNPLLVLGSVLGPPTFLQGFVSTTLGFLGWCVLGVRSFVADQEVASR